MISYITTTFITLFLGTLFYKTDSYNIIKEFIIVKKNKWNRLYNLVSTQHKSKFLITFISIEMISQAFYQSLLQYMDNSVKKIDKNKYELKYIINGKLYKMLIKPDRGPCSVLCITDENDIDVSEKILPYMGPNNNFHNNDFDPKFFGFNILKFEMLNGDIKIFNNSEKIIL